MPISDRTMMIQRYFTVASGNIGTENRKNPYVPIFNRTPARMTEPAVGASVCASGNQVWNGNIGTLMANARKNARNSKMATVDPYAGSWKISGAVLYKA